jgi:hypothetical protein
MCEGIHSRGLKVGRLPVAKQIDCKVSAKIAPSSEAVSGASHPIDRRSGIAGRSRVPPAFAPFRPACPSLHLKRDEFRSNRHRALVYCLRMIFAQTRFASVARENRCTLSAAAALRVRIMR